MDVYSPTNLRKDIYNVLKDIVANHKEVEVATTPDDGVIMLSKKDWNAIQEQLFLEQTGTLDVVFDRMENSLDEDFVEL